MIDAALKPMVESLTFEGIASELLLMGDDTIIAKVPFVWLVYGRNYSVKVPQV